MPPVGYRAFRFAFELPQNLPSSIIFAGERGCVIRITYKLIAKMEDCTQTEKQHFKPLINKRLFVVTQPPERIAFNVRAAKDQNISSMIFWKQGNSKAEVSIDKDAYMPNETIEVRALIDNQACEQSLKFVKVHLYREVTCESTNGSKFSSKVSLMKRKSGGVDPKTKSELIIELPLN